MNAIDREKIIYRYICALERGDLDIIGEVYELADTDETLCSMIHDVHKAMIPEEDREIIETMKQDFYEILRDFGITAPKTSWIAPDSL